MEYIEVTGIKIHNLTFDELNESIKLLILGGGKHIVSNVNINAMNIAYEQKWFKLFLNNASINFCDGDGVRLAAKLKGKNIKQKITYNRWIWDFASFSEMEGFSFYLIGSKQGTIERAKNVLSSKYPNLEIKGYRNGFFNEDSDISDCIADINDKKPNVLILGMGMPHQEKWLLQNREKLSFNVALTGGAVFEYISGNATMTPAFFYRNKLEWLYRFIKEPRRLFKRYIVGNPLFFLRVIFTK